MNSLWQGDWVTRLRIGSGLILFVYAFFHFLNIGMGLFSHEVMHAAQDFRTAITRSLPGEILIFGSLVVHASLALGTLATRNTLRMPAATLVQVVLGLLIPIILLPHLTFTRIAHEFFGLDDQMWFQSFLLWDTADGWKQSALLLMVWVHGCIGLHYWLRTTTWWSKAIPWLTGLAALVPAFALAGFMTEGRWAKIAARDAEMRATVLSDFVWPTSETIQSLIQIREQAVTGFLALLALTFSIYALRKVIAGRRSVRITYVNGPEITAPRGLTLLQMSQSAGVPHTSLCGGKGRCTTCRVVIEHGAEHLPAPTAAETRSLQAAHAAPGSRLACMVRPTQPVTVFRVFRPDGRRGRAHATQGQERQLAILFLDMRGFTSRTTGQLPYDVVFLLNRFFDAIVPAITTEGGTVDKYLGDGLLAIFETADAAASARAAIAATTGIGAALKQFNDNLSSEGAPPVRIGIGLHLGDVVLGEIGAVEHAPRTIIGDTVNTASRLEGRTKELGVELLLSEPLLTAAGYEAVQQKLLALDLRGVQGEVRALAVKNVTDLRATLENMATHPAIGAE
ncbi:MAG: adenylate/guanylate cyclase domain-containing protein [Pseudomonadota bacterium]